MENIKDRGRVMVQLKLNDTPGQVWDIVLTEGIKGLQVELVSDDEYIAQKTKQLLLTGLGEVFYDTSVGLPWFDEILIKNPDLGNVRTLITDILENDNILKDIGITRVDVGEIVLDPIQRNLSIQNLTLVKSDENETVTLQGITI